LTKFKLIRIL